MGLSPRKILYIITKSAWGGAQKYVYDLATHLPKERFQIAVAAGGNGPLFQKLKEAGIRTFFIPGLDRDVRMFKEIKAGYSLFNIIRAEKPDIIHLNSTKIGILGVAAAGLYRLLQFTRAPYIIFTVHGWGFNENRPWFIRALIFLASWCASFFHDKIILINRADARQAERFIRSKKCALIFNGMAPPAFFSRTEARAFLASYVRQEISNDTVLFGTIAELTKNKGLMYLIEAIRELREKTKNLKFKALIIGEGEDQMLLRRLIARYGLSEHIFLAGALPDGARFLNAMDCFVFPSVKEGLPYAILEAMAAGIPIIATAVGGIPDLINHGKTGFLVPPRDPHRLADAILGLIKDRETELQFGKNAQARYRAHFTLDKMLASTIHLYDQLANKIQ